MKYPVMEHFLTIQGEGFHTGTVAYFIRLAGCDVQCPWCDVKESWQEEGHPILSDDELATLVLESGAPIAVITGGEPLLHNLDSLTKKIQKLGVKTHIETSGSSPFSGTFDWVTLSPKRYKEPVHEAYMLADELKVVVANKQDIRWAEKQHQLTNTDALRFLQPEWFTNDAQDVVNSYVIANPKWRVSLQTHKYIGVR